MNDLVDVSLQVNGVRYDVAIRPWRTLLEVLRETLGMTGTKRSCGEGQCGTCSVLIDGEVVNACLYLAIEAQGKEIETIEGRPEGEPVLQQIQRSFAEKGAVQCGFCTPGMVIATKALLGDNPQPSEDEIREALVGHLCRCTGYVQIVEAIQDAASRLARERLR
ncbi:MAG: (2Fe-2S)-binding protein [Betaproteobacteria bacterium RIFCSPLOWO2_02_FULL_63_19]|nr:MAG: (2Fe-2S)-binding protein [Betaproteobacteria bacterium RIFCSPLOWO2_02_FULL_63_19]